MPETGVWKDISWLENANKNMGVHMNLFLYVVDGLLIDCGPQSMEAELAPFLTGTPINQVAITHIHEDHCGNAAWVEKNLNVPIYIHPGDIAEAGTDSDYAEYRRLTWGERPAFHALPMPEVLKTEKYSFNVINAPGHLPRHQVLYEPEQGWLFSGDLYVRSRVRFCGNDENMSQYIDTLKNILRLDFGTVFCAHRGILENGRELLKNKLDFLLELQEKIHSLRMQGMSDEEIDHAVFPVDQFITEVSEGEWASINIVRSI